ncbi:MAG: CDP-diacylglycerol--glycerol-3-phosphate 3-phosphatidyltransferase [Bacilli bacterium]|nr:CDP-diacylglycerol--glycerol-3-phosphate 3-phosphatidyltransferase [Bacilli bacterium]
MIYVNLPTKITVTRLILTVFIVLLLCIPFSYFGFNFPKYDINGVVVELNYIIAGFIFIIASITDFLDGYLARKNNQVTDTGKMLDAIADKVLVNPILIILAANGFINCIIPVIIISRDIIVNAIKMEAASKGKVVAAIKSGKLKTMAMMIGISLVFFYNIPFEFINIRVDLFLLYFACIMSVVSAVQYFRLNKEIVFPKKENN